MRGKLAVSGRGGERPPDIAVLRVSLAEQRAGSGNPVARLPRRQGG